MKILNYNEIEWGNFNNEKEMVIYFKDTVNPLERGYYNKGLIMEDNNGGLTKYVLTDNELNVYALADESTTAEELDELLKEIEEAEDASTITGELIN
jgi:hypothetical protein